MKFKSDDRVRTIANREEDPEYQYGYIDTIGGCDSCYNTYYLESCDAWYHEDDLQLITDGENTMNPTQILKEAKLTPADRLLRKMGLEDSNGNRTSTADQVLAERAWAATREDVANDLKAAEAQLKAEEDTIEVKVDLTDNRKK